MQATFQYRSGQIRRMSLQEANILQHLGHGDVVQADTIAPLATTDVPPTQDLDELTLDQLKALATERGIKYHPNIGLKKLRALIEESKA